MSQNYINTLSYSHALIAQITTMQLTIFSEILDSDSDALCKLTINFDDNPCDLGLSLLCSKIYLLCFFEFP